MQKEITEYSEKEKRIQKPSFAFKYSPVTSLFDMPLHDASGIESIMKTIRSGSALNTGLFVKEKLGYVKIEIADIYLIEAARDYLEISTKARTYVISSTMYSIMEKLPAKCFARVHRSFIVHIDHISAIEDNLLRIENRLIPVSLTYKDDLMSRLNIVS